MDTQWRSEWVNVGAAACSLQSLFGFQGFVKWGIGRVFVGDISEWWLWGGGAASGRLVVWVQEGSWSTICSRRSWGQEEGNIRPAYSTRMSIVGGVWMCDFLCCTFGQLWWIHYDAFLCPFLMHPVSRGSAVYEIFASAFCPGRVLEPWCRLRWRAAPSMQCKVLLMTVFRYNSEDVLHLTKRVLVNPPSLATMLAPMFLEGARQGTGGQEAGQGAVPPGRRGGGQLWLMSCSPCTHRGDVLKGLAQCHVPAGTQALTVILAFSGFAGDFKVL